MKSLGWIAAGAIVVALLAFLIIDSSKDDGEPSASAEQPATATLPTVTAPAATGISAVDALRASVPVPDVHINPPPSTPEGSELRDWRRSRRGSGRASCLARRKGAGAGRRQDRVRFHARLLDRTGQRRLVRRPHPGSAERAARLDQGRPFRPRALADPLLDHRGPLAAPPASSTTAIASCSASG